MSWPAADSSGSTHSRRRAARGAILVLGCWLAGACGSEVKPAETKGPVGTLLGEIRLAEPARMPQYTSADLVRAPLRMNAHAPLPSECQAQNEAARTPVTATQSGLLAGVVVAASDFTRVRARKPRTHRLAIENCRLKPTTIAAMVGDTISIENRDAYEFEPLVAPAFEARPLPRGETLKLPLLGAGLDLVQCSLGAPCGRTDILTFFHPLHAVSDARGRFRIDNFPALELVRVTAWHPLFDVAETFVWLEPGQQNRIVLELTPKTRFVPPALPANALLVPHADP